MGGEDVALLKADNIVVIKGSIKKNDEYPTKLDYEGIVYVAIKHIYSDPGFVTYRQCISTKRSKRLLKRGCFKASSKSKLYLDIDKKGKVWLVDKTFYELNLILQILATKNKLSELYEELDQHNESENYRTLEKYHEIQNDNEYEEYNTASQEELNRSEINSMNEESDGFWNIEYYH